MASYPGATWDKNVQDTGNDGAADPRLGQAADYNEMADEVEALEDDARNAFGAVTDNAATAATSLQEALEFLRPSYGNMVRVGATFAVTTGWTQLTGFGLSFVKGTGFVTASGDTLVIGANGAGRYKVTGAFNGDVPSGTPFDLEFRVTQNGGPLGDTAIHLVNTGARQNGAVIPVFPIAAAADVFAVEVRGSSAVTATIDGAFAIERVDA